MVRHTSTGVRDSSMMYMIRMPRRRGRAAEGGGLLNRYRVVKPYRGFESLRLRQQITNFGPILSVIFCRTFSVSRLAF
jgi:hypothetical protein